MKRNSSSLGNAPDCREKSWQKKLSLRLQSFAPASAARRRRGFSARKGIRTLVVLMTFLLVRVLYRPPRKKSLLSIRQKTLFSNSVCLAAREVMLRIVKLLRSEVRFASVLAHLTSRCAKYNASQRHRRCFTWRSQISLKVACCKRL